MFEVMSDPIDPYAVIDGVRKNAGIGATVSVIGSLRGQSADGRQLSHAECEGDREEAEALLEEISAELGSKWDLIDFAIRHREGRIEVGDVIMVVAVAAKHRQQAFEACQYAVDRAKESLAIREVI
jgi:molybdopterin synthase catalytic subunit